MLKLAFLLTNYNRRLIQAWDAKIILFVQHFIITIMCLSISYRIYLIHVCKMWWRTLCLPVFKMYLTFNFHKYLQMYLISKNQMAPQTTSFSLCFNVIPQLDSRPALFPIWTLLSHAVSWAESQGVCNGIAFSPISIIFNTLSAKTNRIWSPVNMKALGTLLCPFKLNTLQWISSNI